MKLVAVYYYKQGIELHIKVDESGDFFVYDKNGNDPVCPIKKRPAPNPNNGSGFDISSTMVGNLIDEHIKNGN